MHLKISRIKRGLTQSQLSSLSGVGVNTILKIEKKGIDSIKIATLKKIADALNMTIEDLFFSEEE